MYPPVFRIATSSTAVTNLLGAPPNARIFSFGEANQSTQKPYMVWQLVSGHPENYLGCKPDLDYMTTQIDVYASSVSSARNVAQALRDAFEDSGECYIVAWRGEMKEANTNLYRISFDVDWIVER
jgi:hypothetical protein